MARLKNVLLGALSSSVLATFLQQKATYSEVQLDDDSIICSDRNRMSLNEQSLHYSNLRGYGPHRGQPEGMLISEVFPQAYDKPVDLLISTVRQYYPANVSQNAVSGDIVSVSVDAGSTVTLQLTMKHRLTAEPASPGPYGFTFMNFERLTVTGCSTYELSAQTQIEATEVRAKKYAFLSRAARIDKPHMALELSEKEQAGAVSMRCHEPTVTVEAIMRQGHKGDNLYLSGPSNIMCETRATCRSFSCPDFYSPEPWQQSIYCAGDECSKYDIGRCCFEQSPKLCDMANSLMFPPKCVIYSNLGKQGPDFEMPEGIRYNNVFQNSNQGIDMLVNAESQYRAGDYKSHKMNPMIADARHNGLHGKYGIVTVSSGQSVNLRVSFRNNVTDEPVEIDDGFFFTIYDFDNELGGGGQETVVISGYDFYVVTQSTNVLVNDTASSHHGIFQSSVYGTEADNPKNPKKLSPAESDKSVMFGFPRYTRGFNMSLKVSPGYTARKFEFTGFSSMPCPSRGMCKSMECPAGYEHHEEPLMCNKSRCSLEMDMETCCRRIPPARTLAKCDTFVCPYDHELREFAATLNCSGITCVREDLDKCCKRTRPRLCAKENEFAFTNISHVQVAPDAEGVVVRYPNVFPHWHRVIDLEATYHGIPNDDKSLDAPLVEGDLAGIVLPDVATVHAKFRFVEPDSDDEAEMVPDGFFLTFIGGSKGADFAPRRVIVESDGLQEVVLSEDTVLTLESNTSWTLGDFPAARIKSKPLLALDDGLRKHSVTVQLNSTRFSIYVKAIHKGSWNESQDNASLEMNTTDEPTGAADGDADGALLFGGASSLTCRSRPSCATYECPSGFTLRSDAGSLLCSGEACTLDDYPTCCDCDAVSALVFNSRNVVQSTLGAGETGGQKALVVSNVFPAWKGMMVNLRITSVGPYFPGNASKNGVSGSFLNLNLRTSSVATFRFEFIDYRGEAVHVPFNFAFSVFDVDEQNEGGARESIGVTGADWYVLSKPSTVVPGGSEGNHMFSSTSYGSIWDNPVNPLALTDEHLQYSVSLMMKQDTAKFNVTVKVNDGFASRNILFAGQSNLLCSKRAVCSNYKCPVGKVLVGHPSMRLCRSLTCGAEDVDKCCRTPDIQDEAPITDVNKMPPMAGPAGEHHH